MNCSARIEDGRLFVLPPANPFQPSERASEQTMRFPVSLFLLCTAGPTLADQKLSHDFRGARFDPKYFEYVGPTPDKFWNVEAEGLRLRYTGADVPPTNDPAGVAWRVHVRGNFVATAQYEVLKCEPPANGTFLAGVELYIRLDNPNQDAIMVARGVYPNGSTAFDFKALVRDANGKRPARDFKLLPTTEKSLRGRLRLARTGSIVTASFAEGDDTQFAELQRSDIGTADIRLARFAGIAGGDRKAVLDMRILEFHLEGEALALDGRFETPLPKTDVPKEKADLPKADVPEAKAESPRAIAEDFPRPAPEPEPANHRNLLTLAVVLALLVMAMFVSIVLLARWRKAVIAVANTPASQKGTGKVS
jgi:hypothetical protein